MIGPTAPWQYTEYADTILTTFLIYTTIGKGRRMTVIQYTTNLFPFSQVAVVPRLLILQLIASIRIGLVASGYIKEERAGELSVHHCSRLAEDFLLSSSSEVVITLDLDLGAFCALFSGANLRIETLGLLYTMAARSSLYAIGHGHDNYQDDGFIREMGWYGNLSLRLARELAPQTTDLITWLAYENLQFTTLIEGDASK